MSMNDPYESKPLSEDKKKQHEDSLLAALSYVWILCLVPLFLRRDSSFVQHHAKQGLLLFAVEIVGWPIFGIPVIGWFLGLVVLVLAITGFVKALSGEEWNMPFLGKYAKKINL